MDDESNRHETVATTGFDSPPRKGRSRGTTLVVSLVLGLALVAGAVWASGTREAIEDPAVSHETPLLPPTEPTERIHLVPTIDGKPVETPLGPRGSELVVAYKDLVAAGLDDGKDSEVVKLSSGMNVVRTWQLESAHERSMDDADSAEPIDAAYEEYRTESERIARDFSEAPVVASLPASLSVPLLQTITSTDSASLVQIEVLLVDPERPFAVLDLLYGKSEGEVTKGSRSTQRYETDELALAAVYDKQWGGSIAVVSVPVKDSGALESVASLTDLGVVEP